MIGIEPDYVTGASGAIPASDEKRRTAHAELFYEEVRKRTTDVQIIAKNTGWPVATIEKIKRHVFFALHDLGYEEPARFDADYNMALSWQRLTEGTSIREEDLVLLRHELLELTLMEKNGMPYSEAHIQASEQFDYASIIKLKEKAHEHIDPQRI
jgi:hypothetical protein